MEAKKQIFQVAELIHIWHMVSESSGSTRENESFDVSEKREAGVAKRECCVYERECCVCEKRGNDGKEEKTDEVVKKKKVNSFEAKAEKF